MKIGILPSALFAMSSIVATGWATDAAAMNLSSRGMGQVLEFPYYTVNADQQTLLTLVNYSSAVKAVKVRFREAYDGRAVASFNVYLSPFDVWTGVVFKDGSTVAIGTRDTSCTVPKFDASVSTVGIPAFAFSTDAFVGTHSDGGPTSESRLHEGHFEVFEMGEVSSDTHGLQTATYHDNGVPHDCGKLVSAWNSGGVWASNPATDLSSPMGQLFGSSAIVNVGSGTYFAVAPSVIDGFSTTVQHTAPASSAPDFDTASSGIDGKVTVSVDVGGHSVTARFGRSADAIGALFMQSESVNEYVALQGVSEQTDWVSTFPTKRFYVDPALTSAGNQVTLFDSKFGEVDPFGSCIQSTMSVLDREGSFLQSAGCGFLCPAPPLSFCHETNVLSLSSTGSALHSMLGDMLPAVNLTLSEGYMSFKFSSADPDIHTLRSDDGISFLGLPMTGFVAENFINANVTPGVLANYSAAVPHRSILTCARVNGDTTPACP